MRIATLYLPMLFAVILSGCEKHNNAASKTEFADTAYKNGYIYTVNRQHPWAEAIAVKDGRFIYVGDNDGLPPFIGSKTQVVDLEKKMVLPGLYDSHVHPLNATIQKEFEFSFQPNLLGEDFKQALKAFSERSQDEWISGGIWSFDLFPEGGPHKSTLDDVVSDRPVALWDVSHHHLWVNSKTLDIAGINRDTNDPENGKIVRDTQGEPTGVLMETAAFQVSNLIPVHSKQRYVNAAEKMQKLMNSYGVVAITDAYITAREWAGYQQLIHAQRLTLQATLALVYEAGKPHGHFIDNLNNYDGIELNFVKLFLDGVPFSHTAAMLEPYTDDPTQKGKVHYEQSTLNQMLIDFDKAGLTVKMHCVGDAAVRSALDAIAAARAANGDSGIRHQVAHTEFISPDDIPRFKALNAVAEVSPILWHADIIHEQGIKATVGAERTDSQYPIRSLVESGALVIAGTDWPAAVPTPNPWPGIEAMITRENPYNRIEGKLNPNEAITLETALKIYTINAAKALDREANDGSIETNKSANFIVIDRNLFEIPPADISDVNVLQTVFKGKTVFAN